MILKVILAAIIILAISVLGIGLKLLFNKPSKQAVGDCRNNDSSDQKFGCGCGGGLCGTAL